MFVIMIANKLAYAAPGPSYVYVIVHRVTKHWYRLPEDVVIANDFI